jgi:hypothetical protein
MQDVLFEHQLPLAVMVVVVMPVLWIMRVVMMIMASLMAV